MIALRITSDPRLLSIVRAMVGQLCDLFGLPAAGTAQDRSRR